MHSSELPLLSSKISLPQITLTVARPRLQLSPNALPRLTLVCAPAGAGKTSAMLEASLGQQSFQICWYALDPTDNQPLQFCRYLRQSLSRCLPQLASLPLPDQIPAIDSFSHALRCQLQQQQQPSPPTLLLLDDWHLIDNPQLQQLLQDLIQQAPDWLRIMLASRSLPDWPWLAGWRLRGWLHEIDYAQLAFTDAEALQLFQQRLPGQWQTAEVQSLNQQLEGWALGLQALSLQSPIRLLPDLPPHQLSDYLLQEVVRQQPSAIQNFLRQSCLTERFNLQLLQQACGPDSMSLLAEVYRQRLFIHPLDAQHQWFRYHHLFAQTLSRQWQQQDQQGFQQQHARWAMAWHQQGQAAEALHHALASRDLQLLIDLLLAAGWSLQRQGYLELLEACCQQLGEPLLLQNPELVLLYCWHLFLNRRQPQQARQLLQLLYRHYDCRQQSWYMALLNLECHIAFELCESARARQLIEQEIRPDSLPDLTQAADFQNYLGLYSVLAEYEFNRGRTELALTYYQRELQLHLRHWRATRLWCQHQIGMIRLQQGQCLQAEHIWQQALQAEQHPLKQHFSGWCLHLGLAELHLGQGLLQQAEYDCQQALSHCGASSTHPWQFAPYSFLVRIYRLSGQTQLMQDYWQRCQALQQQYPQHPVTLARLDAIQLQAWQTNPQALQQWLEQHPLQPDWPNPVQQSIGRNRALALALLQDYSQMLNELLPLAEQAQQSGLLREYGRNLLWLSLAAHHLQDGRQQNWLHQLLEQLEPWALFGEWLEYKPLFAPLLAEFNPQSLSATGLQNYQRLREHSKNQVASRRAELPEAVRALGLTAQEWQILQRIGLQLSNEQIADQLCVSLATIKTHINRLYRKLQLTDRNQAIDTACRLRQRISEGGTG